MAEETNTNYRMKWTDEHVSMLLKEILIFEPFSHKYGSEERGKCWERISETLNDYRNENGLSFKVTQRSVRDRFKALEKKYKQKNANEERASGINPPEETDLEKAIRDVIERFKEKQLETSENERDKAKELVQGQEMRLQSLETFSESNKRKCDDDFVSPQSSKKRNTGSETFRFLQEKANKESEMKELELKMRKEELDEKRRLEEMRDEREKQRLDLQQQQMAQQQNTTLALINQQQQQTNQVMQQQQQMMNMLFELIQKK